MNPSVTPSELKERLEAGERLNLIDVREGWEYDEKNIGARCVPLAELPTSLDELTHLTRKEVIVLCQSGNRSIQARKYLTSQGFEQVRTLEGGLDAYLSQLQVNYQRLG